MDGDLPATGGHAAGASGVGERDLVLAVRRALDDDGAWSPERLGLLAERADRRAARRRRRRLVAAPLAAVAVAAAVVAGLLVVPPLVTADRAADRAAGPATGGPLVAAEEPDSAVEDAAVGAGRLTTDEVRTVVAGAQAQPALGHGEPEDTTLRDACGTGQLTATRPLQRQTGTWQGPWAQQRWTDLPSTDLEMLSPALLRSQVDTYADDASAAAAAEQLRESVRTCDPAPGTPQPSYPVVREVLMADAFYGVRDLPAAGQYTVTAVQVRGTRTASVTAVVDGVHDQQTQEQVASQVAQLAAVASSRAEAPAWVVPGPTSDVLPAGSPVTTAEVQRLLPGAQVTPELGMRLTARGELDDACGTAPLTGLAEPVRVERSAYTDPDLSYVDFLDDAPTAMGLAAVVVSAVDLGTPEDARAYAEAFSRSASTCTPEAGTPPPSRVDLLPRDAADALLTTAYDEGAERYWYAGVVVRGSHAATVLARVPGTANRDVATAAAQRTVDLAATAADHAAAETAAADDQGETTPRAAGADPTPRSARPSRPSSSTAARRSRASPEV